MFIKTDTVELLEANEARAIHEQFRLENENQPLTKKDIRELNRIDFLIRRAAVKGKREIYTKTSFKPLSPSCLKKLEDAGYDVMHTSDGITSMYLISW